jgi:1-acyl-sn-glycerol-3-phosphate acyltransferase
MLQVRSFLFNVAFYLNLIVQMILWTPFYFLAPRRLAWYVPKFWSRTSMWLLEKITGAKSEITGIENLPAGSYILAPKHQSFWDTISFLPYIPDALYILKRELRWIPFFGWYIIKMRMVPVDRGRRSSALKQAIARTREEMKENRQLIIYPEGTRRPPGAEPSYKWGIVELYSELDLPVVPIVHQAGLFWPRRKFLRYPGVIKARFLPPIPPGLGKEEFLDRLILETETACDEILVEIARGPNPPPLPDSARQRLQELGVAVEDEGTAARR